MAAIRTKLKKVFLIMASAGLFLLVFIIDVVRWSADLETGWIEYTRDTFVIAAFVALYFLIESLWKQNQKPVKKLGFMLVVAAIVGIGAGMLSELSSGTFDVKNNALYPSGFDAILMANLFGVVLGVTMLLVYLTIRDIILARRRKGTRRNLFILTGCILLSAVVSLPSKPLETGYLQTTFFVLTILLIVLNSFRLSWIVYLSKREKLFSLIYGFILFLIFIGYTVVTIGETTIGKSLLFYSKPVTVAIRSVGLLGTIYFGMTFVSTLFHLPTAEAFDRKISEVTSLHNLSRLVTQVFDFNELVDSVTKMTLEVCEAKNSWLEILREEQPHHPHRLRPGEEGEQESIMTVSLKNITEETARAIMTSNGVSLRKVVIDSRKPLVIDDVKEDSRTKHLSDGNYKISSMVIVPLVSHDGVIGILYATKDIAYGFDHEDVDLISAFADQATIAIENSRLIKKSLERERLMREMLLAQDMQRKLLPQSVPSHPNLDIEALSTPAFEVGGDYYDFTTLDEKHIGILVGDVSGKGVSAAFYMAEMKGIFQSLSKIYRSPREFLIKAHEALAETIDKRSFISLVYAVLDLETGNVRIARAGHCPVLYVSAGKSRYVKPQGMGLGMGTTKYFEKTISDEVLHLQDGDVVVLYTDGVTEAHPKNGDEFGYERLQSVVESSRATTAEGVRDAIISAVDRHMEHESPEDDLTIVVLRWKTQRV
jgi:sigma-B regulation protein RsbU (phosphoserine phosphatase)